MDEIQRAVLADYMNSKTIVTIVFHLHLSKNDDK